MNFAPTVLLAFCITSCATNLSQSEGLPSSIQLQGDEFVLSFGEPDNPHAPNLKQFLDQIGQVSQIELHYSQETGAQLASTRLRLIGNKAIPKEKFLTFVQILLAMNDFVVTPSDSEGEGHYLVEHLAGRVPTGIPRIRTRHPYIAESD
ncbi:MAG: hypothetical protein ACI87O_002036 [Planctomycetota bacterium]|jgi:hypothetical protein